MIIKVGMDIAEIRRTVYGRDMREPIADACEILKRNYEAEGIFASRPVSVDVESIGDDDYLLLLDT